MSSHSRMPRSGYRFVCGFVFFLVLTAASLPLRSQNPPPPSQSPAPPASPVQPAPAAQSETAPPSQTPSATQPSSPQSPQPAPPAKPDSELSMQDTRTTFKIRVNLVQVHVVVRDSHDKPVENLKREDFQLFDQGKPQVITNFSVETAESRRERAVAAAKTQSTAEDADAKTASLPGRFIALFFDDVHLELRDVLVVRQAAVKFLADLAPGDRVAITTSSGQMVHEFTSDRDALKKTLDQLQPRPLFGQQINDCPEMSDYLADQIENQRNDQALLVVAQQIVHCQFSDNQSNLPQAL